MLILVNCQLQNPTKNLPYPSLGTFHMYKPWNIRTKSHLSISTISWW